LALVERLVLLPVSPFAGKKSEIIPFLTGQTGSTGKPDY
jgi:hypothetical protein